MKNNKLTSVLVLFALILINSVQAQNYYFALKGGLSWPATADELGSSSDAIGQTIFNQNDDGTYTSEALHGTLGEGYNAQLTVGYFFNQNFGVELNGMYFRSNDITQASTLITDPTGLTYNANDITYSENLRVNPALLFRSGTSPLNIYGRVGLVVPVGGKKVATLTIDDETGRLADFAIFEELNPIAGETGSATIVAETHGQFSLGFLAAAGLEYPINETGFSLFAEVEYMGLTIKSKESEYIQYDLATHGTFIVDINADDRTYADNHINYVDELTETSNIEENENFDENVATDHLATKVNYSGIGLNIGLRFTLGGGSE